MNKEELKHKQDNNHQYQNPPTIEDDEIDLIEVAKTIWNNRRIIYKTVAVFFVLGLLVAFLSPVEFESETVLLPEIEEKQLGGSAGKLLQQFGGLAGLSMSDMQTGTINPQLYPQILKSAPFLLHLMEQPVYFGHLDKTVTVFEFFNDPQFHSFIKLVIYTVALPGKLKQDSCNEIITGFKHRNDGAIKFTKEQKEVADVLEKRIKVNLDDKNGTVKIVSEMPDPEASAAITNIATRYLTAFVTDYKLNKVKLNLDFIGDRYADAKTRFEKAQNALAGFRDKNILITTARARTEEERLQTEYNLAFNVYNTLAQQMEQAKIKVQEETPVFNVLEPVKVSLEKSKPKRVIIMIVAMVLGLVFGITFILVSNACQKIKNQMK
jgi:uncharacterized protein involved in exopolysaccharide biosynthesis